MRNKSATTLSNIVRMRIECLRQKRRQCYTARRIQTGSHAKANTMTFQVLYEQRADLMFAKDASLIVGE